MSYQKDNLILRNGVDIAIRAAGGQAKLADILGVRPQAISAWKHVPELRVYQIEELLRVSRYKLRPDLFNRKDEAR